MITKTDMATKLRAIGYDAEVIEGVLVVWVDVPMRRGEKCKIRRLLETNGYRGSWGWRLRKEDAA